MAENLFYCLTPFSKTYELRGYISAEINGRYGVTVWHVEWHVIKAFFEKQGLVVNDQSTALNSIALCIALIREPHTPV